MLSQPLTNWKELKLIWPEKQQKYVFHQSQPALGVIGNIAIRQVVTKESL